MRAPKKKPTPAPEPRERTAATEELNIHLAPAAEARLGDAGAERLTAGTASEASLPGWQSLGKDHKPSKPNGRQGPGERKVRW